MDKNAIQLSNQLRDAINQGDLQRCRALVLAGADLESKNPGGWTVLHAAVNREEDSPEIVRLLLEAGASIDPQSAKGRWKAIHLAAINGHTKSAELLLQSGAEANETMDKNWTPLHLAAHHGHADVVALLLQHGADADAMTERGTTPVELAERQGHDEPVLEIAKAISLRHSDRVKALKVLRDRKRDGEGKG